MYWLVLQYYSIRVESVSTSTLFTTGGAGAGHANAISNDYITYGE